MTPGRYRKLFPRLWRHPGFRALSEKAQLLTLYLLAGPQTNRIGLFHFSAATAAEDLDTTVETIKKGLGDVASTFGWTFDAVARVVYIPSWWKWNAPENTNVLKGNLKDLNEVPPSGLTGAFARNIGTLDQTFHQTFIEGLRLRLPERPPIQDQDQDQKQEQEPALRAVAPSPSRKPKPHDDNVRLRQLLSLAHDALKHSTKDASVDQILDAFGWCARQRNVTDYTRAEALEVVNVALAERHEKATA